MKKIVFIIVFLFVLLINFTDTNDSEEIRFRVIANSNEQNDQELKMKIVNKLKNENISLDNLGILKSKVEYIVLSNNYNYKVDVCIKNQEYETKYYNNKIIEGGTYKSVVITIGEGKGNNYWTILYPQYFNIGFEDVNTGTVKYDIWLLKKIKEWRE